MKKGKKLKHQALWILPWCGLAVAVPVPLAGGANWNTSPRSMPGPLHLS